MHAELKLIGARDRSEGSESSTVKPNRVESKTHHMVQTVILSQPKVWKLLLAHLVKVNVGRVLLNSVNGMEVLNSRQRRQ